MYVLYRYSSIIKTSNFQETFERLHANRNYLLIEYIRTFKGV